MIATIYHANTPLSNKCNFNSIPTTDRSVTDIRIIDIAFCAFDTVGWASGRASGL